MTEGIDKQCQLEVEGYSAFNRARIKLYIQKKKEKTSCAD